MTAVTSGFGSTNIATVTVTALSFLHACSICVVATGESNCDHAIVVCSVGVGSLCSTPTIASFNRTVLSTA